MRRDTTLDFDLRFEVYGDKYCVDVLDSPYGQARSEFGKQDLPPLDVGIDMAKDLGERLFTLVFRGEVLALLRRSLDLADQQDSRLRLLLRFTAAPSLADLPWEYLYDPTLGGFLALQGHTPVVRYMEVPQPHRPLATVLPLNILVVAASPRDYSPVDEESEWLQLKNGLSSLEKLGLVRLERLSQATPLHLQRRLRQANFHMLHFIGHGDFDAHSMEGVLLLEDENGFGKPISSQHWSMLLGERRRTLGLVMLNACKTAQAHVASSFSGIAQGMVRLGIPAVIANRADIPDQAAIALSRELYQALAEGKPIDVALAEGRKALYNEGYSFEWGIPVLFLRSDCDGRIFQVKENEMSDKKSRGAERVIDTGGGSYFEGDVDTGGGDILGRTEYTYPEGQSTVTIEQFAELLTQIRAMLPETELGVDDISEIKDDLDRIQQQLASTQPSKGIIMKRLSSTVAFLAHAATVTTRAPELYQMAQQALQWAQHLFR